jgi:WD40 repeat protein
MVFWIVLAAGLVAAQEDLPPGAVRRLGTPQAGEQEFFTRLALSPDGRTVACGRAKITIFGDAVPTRITLWDVMTGREVMQLDGHDDWVWSVAFSPDGKHLASGGGDGRVVVWDVRTARRMQELRGRRGSSVLSVAFTPDGREVVSGGLDDHVHVWDLSTGVERLYLQADSDVFSIAVSADDTRLASNTGEVWDLRTGRVLYRGGRASNVIMAGLSPDGALLAKPYRETRRISLVSAGSGEELAAWDWEGSFEGTPRRNWTNDIADFSPDSRMVVSGSPDGTVRVRDIGSGREVVTFSCPSSMAHSFAWTQDGKFLLTGMFDNTVLVWELPAPKAARPAGEGDLVHQWKDLAGHDAPRAFRAMKTMAAEGDRAVAFLAGELASRTPVDVEVLGRLISELASDDVTAREAATAELERRGDAAEPRLRAELGWTRSPEAKARLLEVLRLLDRPKLPLSEGPELQRWRGLWVLEDIGSPEALKALETLAREASSTRERKWAEGSASRIRARRRPSGSRK